MNELVLKLINQGKEWLTEEYGFYEGLTTGMEIEEDFNKGDIEENLKQYKEIKSFWWDGEYTLFMEFN